MSADTPVIDPDKRMIQQCFELLATQDPAEVPVAAIVARGGRVIASALNRTEGDMDPTAHAEILAIRQACQTLRRPFLSGCELFVTLEPCEMCLAAASHARIRRVVYGARQDASNTAKPGSRCVNHEGCGEVLKDFFDQRRR